MRRILVAEDEEHISSLIRFKLAKEGFEVTLAKNGKEAVDHLESHSWALVILDIMMPFYTGWQVLDEIRSRPQLGRLPVLLLSAKNMREDPTSPGFKRLEDKTRFLRKPFDPTEFAAVVNQMVQM